MAAPASIAVTPDGSQVWVSEWGGGRVDVFDLLTNAGVPAFNVPSSNGIAFNPSGTRAYLSSGENKHRFRDRYFDLTGDHADSVAVFDIS